MHDADDVVLGSCFCLDDISVSEKCDCVFVNLDDSMDQVVTINVADKGHCSYAKVFLLPWTEGQLVAKVNHEGVHAVALHSECDSLSFLDQSPDLFHHNGFIYSYCL